MFYKMFDYYIWKLHLIDLFRNEYYCLHQNRIYITTFLTFFLYLPPTVIPNIILSSTVYFVCLILALPVFFVFLIQCWNLLISHSTFVYILLFVKYMKWKIFRVLEAQKRILKNKKKTFPSWTTWWELFTRILTHCRRG